MRILLKICKGEELFIDLVLLGTESHLKSCKWSEVDIEFDLKKLSLTVIATKPKMTRIAYLLDGVLCRTGSENRHEV